MAATERLPSCGAPEPIGSADIVFGVHHRVQADQLEGAMGEEFDVV